MEDLRELEAKALEIMIRDTGRDDLAISAVQRLAEAPAGYQVYVFSGAPAPSINASIAAVALTESGKEVGMDTIIGKPLVPVFPVKPDLGPPIDADLPDVTIDPPVNDLHLDPCEEFTETIRVFIPAGGGTPRADVYFLADTTGSMGSIIGAVQAGASSILSSLAGLGLDIVYGVGNYKDFPHDPYAFQHQLNPTNNVANVQTAIGTWAAGGGADLAEGQLFALDQLAQPPGGSIGWRNNSKRIIVWFGDAPGHDPVCPAISGLPYNITEGSVTVKLVNEQITVLAVSTSTSVGLDGDPTTSTDYSPYCGTPGGSPGQATRIANATGGQHVVGINASTIVTTIVNLIQNAINTINNVSLVPTGAIIPFVTSISPAGGYGPLNGNVDNTLTFTVTFTGSGTPCSDTPQVFKGTLDVVADGVVVAQKPTTITQEPCGYTYSVKFLCGTQEKTEECAPVRPGTYSTEINIQNPLCAEVKVERYITPLVLAGDAIGRDPNVVTPTAHPHPITLPPQGATMEDCCWIVKMLDQDPNKNTMNIGFVLIRSKTPLAVTAVYTVNSPDCPCTDVEVVTYDPILG